MFSFGKGNKNKTDTRVNSGDSVSTSFTTQEFTRSSSYSSTTQTFESRSCIDTRSIGAKSPIRLLEETKIDAIPFKSSSARSAFFSEPLTSKPSNHLIVNKVNSLSPLVFNERAKNQTTSFPSLSAPKQILRPSNHLAVTSSSLPVIRNESSNIQSTDSQNLRGKLKIKVIKSGKLYDDPTVSKVPVYSTHSKSRGKLLLINNIKFISQKQNRKGAELDEVHLVELFRQMGFSVVKYRDLKKKEMEDRVLAFRNDSSLKKVDICVVVIMSHGFGGESSDSTEVACVDGQTLHTNWIINQFDNDRCPNLVATPKIFIFQCCRGDQKNIQHDSVPSQLPRKLSDILIAYSTIPGFVSHRDPNTGTWYIQAICKIFMEHAYDTDVESLLKMVDQALSKLVTGFGSRQTSSFENRGFKTCYLHP